MPLTYDYPSDLRDQFLAALEAATDLRDHPIASQTPDDVIRARAKAYAALEAIDRWESRDLYTQIADAFDTTEMPGRAAS